jgi:hypothetical protein
MQAQATQPKDVPYWGLDLSPENRPGVPRETPPRPLPGAHWIEPERQPTRGPVLTRAGLPCPTPVFSTALPPKGVSGALRCMAYRIPDHRVRHWILLFVADRIDVAENMAAWFTRQADRQSRLKGTAAQRR